MPKYSAAQKRGQRAKEARARALRNVDPTAPLGGAAFAALLDRQVAGAIAPSRQEIARARKESQRLSGEAATRTQGLAEAYAELLKEIAPATEAAYGNARDAQASLARGFSAQQTASQQTDAAQAAALLSRIGAPAAQSQQVQGMGAGVGDVSYGLGGYIPSTALNQQGAAFGAQARQLPAYALGRGQQQVGAIRKAQQAREKELDDKLADLLAQVPGLRAKYYSDLAGAENAKEATRIQREYLGIAGQKQKLSEYETVAGVTGVDPTTGLPTVAAKTAAQTKGSAAKKARMVAFDTNSDKAAILAAELAEGKRVPDSSLRGYHVQKPNYNTAYRMVMNRYGKPLIRTHGVKRSEVDAMIRQVLADAGFAPRPKKKVATPSYGLMPQ